MCKLPSCPYAIEKDIELMFQEKYDIKRRTNGKKPNIHNARITPSTAFYYHRLKLSKFLSLKKPLERIYTRKQYLNRQERQKLAEVIDLTPKQLRIWVCVFFFFFVLFILTNKNEVQQQKEER